MRARDSRRPAHLHQVARVGPGMPTVGTMHSFEHIRTLERVMNDKSKSDQVRAVAAGRWLQVAATTRTIDMQRTRAISFEKTEIVKTVMPVACGIARKSKARNRFEMRPLEWRTPLIPVSEDHLDFEPLLRVMRLAGEGQSCIYPDWSDNDGNACSILVATRVCNRAASHARIVAAVQAIIEDDCDGHDARHVVPEVGRALDLSKSKRQGLGHWRGEKTIADDKRDMTAFRRAITAARNRATRGGRLAEMADRYASVYAESVVMDDARACCLLAIREQIAKWDADGVPIPESTREQIAAIHASAAASSPKTKRLRNLAGSLPYAHDATANTGDHGDDDCADGAQSDDGDVRANSTAPPANGDDADATGAAIAASVIAGGLADADESLATPAGGSTAAGSDAEFASPDAAVIGSRVALIELSEEQADQAVASHYLAERAGALLGYIPGGSDSGVRVLIDPRDGGNVD